MPSIRRDRATPAPRRDVDSREETPKETPKPRREKEQPAEPKEVRNEAAKAQRSSHARGGPVRGDSRAKNAKAETPKKHGRHERRCDSRDRKAVDRKADRHERHARKRDRGVPRSVARGDFNRSYADDKEKKKKSGKDPKAPREEPVRRSDSRAAEERVEPAKRTSSRRAHKHDRGGPSRARRQDARDREARDREVPTSREYRDKDKTPKLRAGSRRRQKDHDSRRRQKEPKHSRGRMQHSRGRQKAAKKKSSRERKRPASEDSRQRRGQKARHGRKSSREENDKVEAAAPKEGHRAGHPGTSESRRVAETRKDAAGPPKQKAPKLPRDAAPMDGAAAGLSPLDGSRKPQKKGRQRRDDSRESDAANFFGRRISQDARDAKAKQRTHRSGANDPAKVPKPVSTKNLDDSRDVSKKANADDSRRPKDAGKTEFQPGDETNTDVNSSDDTPSPNRRGAKTSQSGKEQPQQQDGSSDSRQTAQSKKERERATREVDEQRFPSNRESDEQLYRAWEGEKLYWEQQRQQELKEREELKQQEKLEREEKKYREMLQKSFPARKAEEISKNKNKTTKEKKPARGGTENQQKAEKRSDSWLPVIKVASLERVALRQNDRTPAYPDDVKTRLEKFGKALVEESSREGSRKEKKSKKHKRRSVDEKSERVDDERPRQEAGEEKPLHEAQEEKLAQIAHRAEERRQAADEKEAEEKGRARRSQEEKEPELSSETCKSAQGGSISRQAEARDRKRSSGFDPDAPVIKNESSDSDFGGTKKGGKKTDPLMQKREGKKSRHGSVDEDLQGRGDARRSTRKESAATGKENRHQLEEDRTQNEPADDSLKDTTANPTQRTEGDKNGAGDEQSINQVSSEKTPGLGNSEKNSVESFSSGEKDFEKVRHPSYLNFDQEFADAHTQDQEACVLPQEERSGAGVPQEERRATGKGEKKGKGKRISEHSEAPQDEAAPRDEAPRDKHMFLDSYEDDSQHSHLDEAPVDAADRRVDSSRDEPNDRGERSCGRARRNDDSRAHERDPQLQRRKRESRQPKHRKDSRQYHKRKRGESRRAKKDSRSRRHGRDARRGGAHGHGTPSGRREKPDKVRPRCSRAPERRSHARRMEAAQREDSRAKSKRSEKKKKKNKSQRRVSSRSSQMKELKYATESNAGKRDSKQPPRASADWSTVPRSSTGLPRKQKAPKIKSSFTSVGPAATAPGSELTRTKSNPPAPAQDCSQVDCSRQEQVDCSRQEPAQDATRRQERRSDSRSPVQANANGQVCDSRYEQERDNKKSSKPKSSQRGRRDSRLARDAPSKAEKRADSRGRHERAEPGDGDRNGADRGNTNRWNDQSYADNSWNGWRNDWHDSRRWKNEQHRNNYSRDSRSGNAERCHYNNNGENYTRKNGSSSNAYVEENRHHSNRQDSRGANVSSNNYYSNNKNHQDDHGYGHGGDNDSARQYSNGRNKKDEGRALEGPAARYVEHAKSKGSCSPCMYEDAGAELLAGLDHEALDCTKTLLTIAGQPECMNMRNFELENVEFSLFSIDEKFDTGTLEEFEKDAARVEFARTPSSDDLVLAGFENSGLSNFLEKGLNGAGFERPLPIQKYAVPYALKGYDVVGVAKTGSGKTLAFVLPAMEHLYLNKNSRAMVMAPTRELADQIHTEAARFGRSYRMVYGAESENQIMSTAVCYGGVPKAKQYPCMLNANFWVGTPGRLMDFFGAGQLTAANITFLVLDEADKMLDEGFLDDIHYMLERMPSRFQLMCFSATWNKAVQNLVKEFRKMRNLAIVRVGQEDGDRATANANVRQDVVVLPPDQRGKDGRRSAAGRPLSVGTSRPVSPRLGGRPTAGGNNDERPRGGGGGGRRLRSIKKLGYIRHKQMRRQLCRTHVERAFASNPRAKILVFSDYKVDCDEIKEELFKAGVGQVRAMHGDMKQQARLNTLESFRTGETRVLVATNVLGRGMDIDGVTHVVMLEFDKIEDYVHRIGRTARGEGGVGHSLQFFDYWYGQPSAASDLLAVLEESGQRLPKELMDIAEKVRTEGPKWDAEWKI